jgi:hypothetical protein
MSKLVIWYIIITYLSSHCYGGIQYYLVNFSVDQVAIPVGLDIFRIHALTSKHGKELIISFIRNSINIP